MTAVEVLERSYRRWLRCYPRAFRREHEDEMVGVLMSSAHDGQRRPDAAECLDLVRGAIAMRLRPRIPHSDRSAFTAIKLMYIGAIVELATAITLVATLGDVKSSVVNSDPGLSAASWHAVVAGQIDPLVMSAGIAVVFWLWMAWSRGQGKRWPGIVFALFFAANTWSLLSGLSRGSAVYAQADLAIASVLWLVELAVLVLVVREAVQTIAFARSRTVQPTTG
jgi:hypothetical protein